MKVYAEEIDKETGVAYMRETEVEHLPRFSIGQAVQCAIDPTKKGYICGIDQQHFFKQGSIIYQLFYEIDWYLKSDYSSVTEDEITEDKESGQ